MCAFELGRDSSPARHTAGVGSPMLFSPAAQTATTPQEQQSVMEVYAGEASPMMSFEADLQVVRASPADGEVGLSASRWALTEASIVADR